MKKTKLILITGLTLSLMISLYIIISKAHQRTNTTIHNDNTSIYIDFVDDKLKHLVYEVDLRNLKDKVLLKKELKDYPTSAYSKKNKSVYFTEETKNKTQQLFEKDLQEKNSQLTHNFNYVDFLKLDDKQDTLYMRVLLGKDDRDFHVAKMDLKTREIKVFNKEKKNDSVVWFDYNSNTQQLLVISKSIKEEAKNISLSNENDQPLKAPAYKGTIINVKDNHEKEVFLFHKFIDSASLSPKGKEILFSWKDSIDPEASSTISSFNIKTKEEKFLVKDSKELINVHQPVYSKKQDGFYFIADVNKVITNKNTNTQTHPTAVNFFNLKSKEIESVWSPQKGTVVNIYF
ncbi:hypothetical protein COE67_07745 [Priestia megaterium]|uniref:hypothetical protein n=1 Tax=Priestia megaterium TaxID=1404 RepID=UPI000BEB68CA|nr:hypothetical protein [Priestia megaterium]PEA36891.1 hypothetical protein CON45_22055 [Priestia megaterium]PGX43240.1 hypothetical protein COE67_07745 [Priestia megaterium]